MTNTEKDQEGQETTSSGKGTSFTLIPSGDNHTTQSTTDSLGTVSSQVTTLGSTGISQVTNISNLPASAPDGHTSTQTARHTLSPSGTTTTPFSTADSYSHRTQTAPPTLSVGMTERSTVEKTIWTMPTSPGTNSASSVTTSLPTTTSQTSPTSTSTTVTRSTAPLVPIEPEKGVSLFFFGRPAGDQTLVRRTVDFTSPLFKPRIGFPFGSFLRDSLYFTDNGQVIFPDSDYQLFSYPYPPRSGFTGWDSVALVAPFWDDADFSGYQGTIFYQEYNTLYGESNRLVHQVESWITEFSHTWYKARWTLKVTWVNVPAYPAHSTFGTNTYQAILSTDGSKSYALFLYQNGGMQWDTAQRRGNLVLMGFTSGDGHFQNSPLTFRPIWEKYRPDQFLDFNSGYRGLQVYTLHREERPNYRLKCLQWLNSQPQRPSWGWNHISCPCSWQQGRWDLRFLPTNIGWWGRGNRQLCSYSSWRGGVCCSYGLWGEFQGGWRVQSLWHFDQELEAENWCCRWNDKPFFFCTQYRQRQPRISCTGYRPPRLAWMFGDPHITTLDGANYTFNGLGDFLLVQAQDGNSSFLLQGRTAQTGTAQATNFIAFAAQYKSSSLGPNTVQWFLEPNDKIKVTLNNKPVEFEVNPEDAEGQERSINTTGIILIRNGSLVSASFDGTVAITVIALSNLLHASSSLPEEYQNHTEGLLGVWNGDPNDDFKMPNGSTIPPGSSEEKIFHYGMTWQINGTSLLGERKDELPSNFTPVFLEQLRNSSSDQNVATCKGDLQCIFDTLATKNTSTGLHTQMLRRRFQDINSTLNENPPTIEGDEVVRGYKGQTNWFHYKSSSENVTFSLRSNSTDFKLFENGTLRWTPTSLEPFSLEILARNTKNDLSAALHLDPVACFCSAKSQCVYNQTTRVSNSSLQVADCKCDEGTFGPKCERRRDPCEQCFPGVHCTAETGCGACPPDMTGDGHHCAAQEYTIHCQNKSCPVNYCYNHGHCYIAKTEDCKPTCLCPPAFTDNRCFLAGNNFTPTVIREFPVRIIELLLSEEQNATTADVNASVAHRLSNLIVQAFSRNSMVMQRYFPTSASDSSLRHWRVISEFQYRPVGPVIDFLNNQLMDAVVEAFLPQALRLRRSDEPRKDVVFYPISRGDVRSLELVNVSTLETYLKCEGYKGYSLVYSPQKGFSCVSPCSEGYCNHGGQCQHLPEGPHCSCVSFSIYTSWGDRCEHLSMKLGAFFGILFGALSLLLLLGVVVFVVLHFKNCFGIQNSYPLHSES
ncbi:PREDICTED: mucin-4-like [Elephantulus edwardii]|uniref:mucin-4-like n=1 Tax=Elephantulus edwardii TaxID=28737 RepID=UPI0003F0E2DC|nr:PREDICTED: mucin-4-like [Elephantulus edwardii]